MARVALVALMTVALILTMGRYWIEYQVVVPGHSVVLVSIPPR